MNSAHILTRYLPRATATEQPDGSLLLELDHEAEDRFLIALFCGLGMFAMVVGVFIAIVQHMTVTA